MISAQLVKQLREETDVGFMECKKALTETNGNIEEAKLWLRKQGVLIAEKRAGQETNEGLVGIKIDKDFVSIAKVQCETDFVARSSIFQDFVRTVIKSNSSLNDETQNVISKVGENVAVDKLHQLHLEQMQDNISVTSYIHNQIQPDLGKIGVVVLFNW